MVGDVGGIPLNQRSVGAADLVDQAQFKHITPVGNRRHVASQLHVGVGVVALSHGGTLRSLRGQRRRILRYLDAGGVVQSEHGGILPDNVDAPLGGVHPVFIGGQLMRHIREEKVTGVLNRAHKVQLPMTARMNPALDRRENLVVLTGTVDGIGGADSPLLQRRDSHNRLERGPRRLQHLGGVVVKRQGQIFVQPVVIGRVHGSGQQVVVIAWVGD